MALEDVTTDHVKLPIAKLCPHGFVFALHIIKLD